MDTWCTKRPLWWGLLLVEDRDAAEVPPLAEATVSFAPAGLSVAVRHAQDVDLDDGAANDVVPPAEVEVTVHFSRPRRDERASSGAIELPSGVLTVGDADRVDALEVGPGRWNVNVRCTPHDHADQVDIWLWRT